MRIAGASGVLWRLPKLVAGALDEFASDFTDGLVTQRGARIVRRGEGGVAQRLTHPRDSGIQTGHDSIEFDAARDRTVEPSGAIMITQPRQQHYQVTYARRQ